MKLDTDTTDSNIYPNAGALYSLQGGVLCDRSDGVVVLVTLSSESGRRAMQTGCNTEYRFEGLAPANYEVFAEYSDHTGSGFAEGQVRRNTVLPVQLSAPPQVDFDVVSSATGGMATGSVTLAGRRQDLSGLAASHDIPVPRTRLHAGHWEMTGFAGANGYVESIGFPGRDSRRMRPDRPAEWHDVFVEPRLQTRVRVMISDRAGHVAGFVSTEGRRVAGAPVFLWPLDEQPRRILGGSRQALADTQGEFRFDGLPPGEYRVVSSFDFREVDPDVLQETGATSVRVEASKTESIELALWLAP